MKVCVAFVTLLAMLILKSDLGQGISCDDAKEELFPCLSYILGQDGDKPSESCCEGVSDLKSSTPTKEDRSATCQCLKDSASTVPGIKEDLAASLPQKCGVDIGFTISKDIDCKSIP